MVDLPPDVPTQYAPVVIAQASQVQKGDVKVDRTIGVCQPVENQPDAHQYAYNSVSPIETVWIYFTKHEQIAVAMHTGKASLLQRPEYGVLKGGDGGHFAYASTKPGYIGPDRATVLVEMGGYKVKVMYFFNVLQGVPGGNEGSDPQGINKYCPQGRLWKISLNTK